MTDKENKPEPCRYCKKPEREPTVESAEGVGWFYVNCSECGANGPLRLSAEAAVEAWNTRPDPWTYVHIDGNPKESGEYLVTLTSGRRVVAEWLHDIRTWSSYHGYIAAHQPLPASAELPVEDKE